MKTAVGELFKKNKTRGPQWKQFKNSCNEKVYWKKFYKGLNAQCEVLRAQGGKKIDANKFYNSSNKEKNYLMENGPMEQSFMIPDVKNVF